MAAKREQETEHYVRPGSLISSQMRKWASVMDVTIRTGSLKGVAFKHHPEAQEGFCQATRSGGGLREHSTPANGWVETP